MAPPLSDRLKITAAVLGAIFLAAMDVTAVAPAMPRIIGDLGGGELYAWAFTIYAVLSTTTTPVFGRLADRRGRRPVLLFGIGVFLLGSVACGGAPTMELFLLARGLQGIGAGALLPTAFTIVGDLYDLRARARVQGYLSGVWGVASVLGPLVGGTLVETLGWRWLFYINLPVGLLSAAVIARRYREEGFPRAGAGLDLRGGAYFSCAILLVLLGLELEGALRAGAIAAGVAATVGFVRRERRAPHPLFDLSLFRIPVYRAANLSGFFAGAVLLSLSAFLPVYVMNLRGGSAVLSGLVLTPMSFGWVVASVAGGRLLVRSGYRPIAIPGLLLLSGATFGLSRLGPETPIAIVALLMAGCGLGFGFSFTTFLVAVQEEVGPEKRGEATSAVQFFRQIGGALGVAVLEVVFLARVGEASLLEARPGRVLDAASRDAISGGFREAFLFAALFAAAAVVAGMFAPGGRNPPAGGK
ncbi:MAG: MFS transporter [Planctomycetes bacterium]|jgi:EmrB/QacA subfamily drug resistance transporter|nr:MFS transporter [Planctomycetota bacterium]